MSKDVGFGQLWISRLGSRVLFMTFFVELLSFLLPRRGNAMLHPLDLTVPTPSERFDIVVFSNRAIFSFAFKRLIEESTSLTVSLLPVHSVYCSRLEQNFSGLIVVSMDTGDLDCMLLKHIRESLPLARILLVLPTHADVFTQEIQRQAHSVWSERSSITELLEAAIITFKGGTWIERKSSIYPKPAPARKLLQQEYPQEASDTQPSAHWKSLTEREIQILKLMSEGHSNQQIAESLYISVSTVKNHSARLFSKLGVRNRTGAVIKAIETGLLSQQASLVC
jgi:DNA-binding NarL/FixJ family response regulator